MKKSLMLSTTIMLIILFVALSATTFAWYQASGGTINVSGSSTASVETTGPENPYLLLNALSDFSGINESAASSNQAITFNASLIKLQVATADFSDNSFTFTDIGGNTISENDMSKFTFYIKNTSNSFELAAIPSFSVSIGDTNNINMLDGTDRSYCLALVMVNDTNKTVVYSNYHSGNGTANSKSLGGQTYTITNSNDSNKFAGGVYTCTLYIWIDGYDSNEQKITNSNTVSLIQALSIVSVSFSTVTIVTSN